MRNIIYLCGSLVPSFNAVEFPSFSYSGVVPPPSLNNWCNDLELFKDGVFVGGRFTPEYITFYNRTTNSFNVVSGSMAQVTDRVLALSILEPGSTELFVGGYFPGLFRVFDIQSEVWSAPFAATGTFVSSFLLFGPRVFLCGDGGAHHYWKTIGGSSYERLLQFGTNPCRIIYESVDFGEIFIGGDDGLYLYDIGIPNNATLFPIAGGASRILTLLEHEGVLYIGGSFSSIDGIAADHMAQADILRPWASPPPTAFSSQTPTVGPTAAPSKTSTLR